MIKYIEKPNLPRSDIASVICGTNDEAILNFFRQRDIVVLANKPNYNIDRSVSTHADMAALHTGGREIIIDKSQVNLKHLLTGNGFRVTETAGSIKGKYPDDIALNFTFLNEFVIGNFRFADINLSRSVADKIKISVKQGYCKCSVLVVDENAIITDDESIYSKSSQNGIDCLLIAKGDVALEGHEYGFIGGASGKISADTVAFFGDITLHRDFNKINKFLCKHGCRYVCTDCNALRDIGGIIPLTEKY